MNMFTDDIARYLEYWDRHLQEAEGLCKRCGACCGAMEGDPCVHLARLPDQRFYCRIYETRLGARKTVSGKEFHCVLLRDILHKNWVGKEQCAYIKAIR